MTSSTAPTREQMVAEIEYTLREQALRDKLLKPVSTAECAVAVADAILALPGLQAEAQAAAGTREQIRNAFDKWFDDLPGDVKLSKVGDVQQRYYDALLNKFLALLTTAPAPVEVKDVLWHEMTTAEILAVVQNGRDHLSSALGASADEVWRGNALQQISTAVSYFAAIVDRCGGMNAAGTAILAAAHKNIDRLLSSPKAVEPRQKDHPHE